MTCVAGASNTRHPCIRRSIVTGRKLEDWLLVSHQSTTTLLLAGARRPIEKSQCAGRGVPCSEGGLMNSWGSILIGCEVYGSAASPPNARVVKSALCLAFAPSLSSRGFHRPPHDPIGVRQFFWLYNPTSSSSGRCSPSIVRTPHTQACSHRCEQRFSPFSPSIHTVVKNISMLASHAPHKPHVEDPFVVYTRSLHDYTLQLWTESIRLTQERRQHNTAVREARRKRAHKEGKEVMASRV